MEYRIDDRLFNVVIKKKNNKNIYIRMKDEQTIYVTTSYFTTKNEIKRILDMNQKFILSSLNKILSTKEKENDFYYLGKKYEIILIPTEEDIIISEDSIVVKNYHELENWLKKNMIELFKNRYDYLYNNMTEDLPKPVLKLRKMKTRWGVCNKKRMTITLNTELIKYDIECLDYVIVHELSHLVYFDHSKNFWKQVEKYIPNYKAIRKKLKN